MPQQTLRATHRNGTATATPAKVTTKRGRGFRLLLRNLDGTNPLDVSFDSGKTFYTIEADGKFDEDVSFHFFYVRRGGAADVDYSAVIFEG